MWLILILLRMRWHINGLVIMLPVELGKIFGLMKDLLLTASTWQKSGYVRMKRYLTWLMYIALLCVMPVEVLPLKTQVMWQECLVADLLMIKVVHSSIY